jgi:heptosyltransferase-2
MTNALAKDSERILVIRLDEIGDVVLTTPFLRELRREFPEGWITLVVKPMVHNLVSTCPYVDEVLTYRVAAPKVLRPLLRNWRALRLAKQHLWSHKFDLAVLPRWGVDASHGAFLTFLSCAQRRIGYSERVSAVKAKYNRGHDRLFTDVLADGTAKHEVEHNLDLIRYLGGTVQDDVLELWLTDEDREFADGLLRENGLSSKQFTIALTPGAGAARRKWPLDSFAALGTSLIEEFDVRLVIIGGGEDERLGDALQERLGAAVINTAGQTSLRQSAALIERCRLFIGNDTGPMHLAAAVGVPVVEISCHPETGSPLGPNSPLRFGPWGVPHRIVQPVRPVPPCEDGCVSDQAHCILSISVGRVREAVTELLESTVGSKGVG